MEEIHLYLLRIAAVAILIGIITAVFSKKSTVAMTLNLLCGLMMLLTVIKPWSNLSVNGLWDFADTLTTNGDSIVASGTALAEDACRAGIKEQCEAYILEEARAMGCEMEVDITLSQDNIPIPVRVQIHGQIAPYARQKLSNIITHDLGIPQEEQIWT